MMPRWRTFGDFLRPVFSASRSVCQCVRALICYSSVCQCVRALICYSSVCQCVRALICYSSCAVVDAIIDMCFVAHNVMET